MYILQRFGNALLVFSKVTLKHEQAVNHHDVRSGFIVSLPSTYGPSLGCSLTLSSQPRVSVLGRRSRTRSL